MQYFTALFLFFSVALASSGHDVLHRRHHNANVARGNAAELGKRDTYSGRATFFQVGLGACGDVNVPSDWIVALNTAQYIGGSPGPECFKMITIQYNGITGVAQIMDECPSCNYGDLDMSQGLFDHFASEDLGEFQMTWWYNDGTAPPSSTSSTPAYTPPPATTSVWVPPPTTSTTPAWTPPATTSTPVWTPPSTSTTPTSTWVPPTTSSTTTTTTTTTSTTSSTPTTTSTSSTSATPTSSSSALATTTLDLIASSTPTSATPSSTPTAATINNAADLSQLVVVLGNIIAQAPSSN